MQSIFIFVLVDLAVILSAINITAVSVALPNIITSFSTSLVLAGWVLSIYQLVSICSGVLMGKISDVLGSKKTYLICCCLFIIGSLFSALAPNIQLLIAARFIQSIGGGGLVPVSIGIIVKLFPRHRQRAIGINMSIIGIGGIIGPIIGSWLITGFGWKSIFWFNIPIGILAVLPLFFLLKSDQVEKVHIDFTGAGLLGGIIFSFMIGLTQIAHSGTGLGWLITGLLFIASIFFIVMFIRHEHRTHDPIIDLELLRLKAFIAANSYNFIFGACLFGFSSFIPLYAVSVYNITTIERGYVLMARSIDMIVSSTASGFFLVKWGYRKPMLIGSILMSGSLFLFGFEFSQIVILGTEISPVVMICIFSIISGLGNGIASPAAANACLELRPNRTSTIIGIRTMCGQSGGAISIAIITLVLQSIGDISLGFSVVFISTALIVLLTIPFIFAMPDISKQSLS